MEEWKAQRDKETEEKEAYEKSGGIPHDTAALVFRTKDILKIRIRPQLEPDSDFHLVRMGGLEPPRPCEH